MSEKNEAHAKRVSEGRARAKEIREAWMTALETGELDVDHLIRASREHETRFLSTILLQDILKTLPGWTSKTAVEVLLQNGFGPKDNIQNIRKSGNKIELFKVLMAGTPGQWKPRPKMPEGWPFRGKLDELLETVSSDAVEAAKPKLTFEDAARLHPSPRISDPVDEEDIEEDESVPSEEGDSILDSLNRLIEEHHQNAGTTPEPEPETASQEATPSTEKRPGGLSFFN